MKLLNQTSIKRFLLFFAIQILTYSTAFSQPKERPKNRYKEPNGTYGAPYTLFDISEYNNDKSTGLAKRITLLREQIEYPKSDSVFRKLYKDIYFNYINTPNPSPVSKEDKIYDPLAAHAKNKAFIALVGVDGSGNPLPVSEINRLKDEAYSALENMNTDVLNLIRLHSFGLNAGQLLLYRTRELVQYLQAYDMLKACGRIDNYAEDQSELKHNPRNRLRKFTRNIYDVGLGVWGPARWGDNHSLGFAAAIGLASIVLNDAGVGNSRTKYRPDKWAEKAHKFLNKVMWEGSLYAPKLAVEGQISGYAEGPAYFEYFMTGTGMPFLRALHNYIPYNGARDYLYMQKWQDLFKWRHELTTASGYYFGFDNSAYSNQNCLLLTGIPEFTYLPPNVRPEVGVFLQADLLALHPTINTTDNREEVVSMPHAGQTIMRMKNGNDNHYLMLLHEQGTPVCETGHEDNDAGSIQLGVNGDMLIFDPGYLGWANANLTNSSWVHNKAFIGPTIQTKFGFNTVGNVTTNKGLQTPNGVLYNQIKSEFLSSWPVFASSTMNRNISMFKDFGNVYYIIDDFFKDNFPINKWYSIQFNGNGSSIDSIPTFSIDNNLMKWTHPCTRIKNVGRWNLAALTAAVNGNNSPITISNITSNTWHHTPYELITELKEWKGDYPAGLNSRVIITQQTYNAKFKTILFPYQCEQTPIITKTESANSASITVHFPQGSTIHVSKANTVDTTVIVNPFDSISGKVLLSDADRVVLSIANDSIFKTKNYCESYTYFRKAAMENGTFLRYDSVAYINSLTTAKFSAYYELTGKYKYLGNTHISDSNASVIAQFYLPEVDSGFMMVARGTNVDSSSYNMGAKILTVKLSQGKPDLVIELADPCQLSCFFPPDTINIDSIFSFSSGTNEVLTHDLQILPQNGVLDISNYSVMNLCPNTILYNKDSLFLHSPAPEKRKQIVVCSNAVGINDVEESRSRINVKEGATLILMPNSFTHIMKGGTIYVGKGGTLIIKNGAKLIIGGNSTLGYGELFLDKGSNLCVEQGAEISFYPNKYDTSDKNLFWAFLNQGGSQNTYTNIGVNQGSNNYHKLLDSSFITANQVCTQLCNFVTVFPQDGIKNKAWGYFPAGAPYAKFTLPSNVLCAEDSVILFTKDVLNETNWEYEVCEISKEDSSIIGNGCTKFGDLNNGGDGCKEYNILPERINLSATYGFKPDHLYKIRLKVRNGCMLEHDTSQIIYIALPTMAFINFPVNFCETDTVKADSFYFNMGNSVVNHIWTVDNLNDLIDNDVIDTSEEVLIDRSGYWELDTAINPSFNFPGFYFKGGNSYVISLSVISRCNNYTFSDTIHVPLGVNIEAEAIISANKVIGNPNIKLKGNPTTTITSFSWNPENSLLYFNTLEPLTTGIDSMTLYTLSVSDGQCYAYDTIEVKYNNYLFMGNDTATCKGTALLLGNKIEESLLFGLLGTIDYNTFGNYFESYINADALFAKRFGIALLARNYTLCSIINQHKEFFDIIKFHRQLFYTKPDYVDVYEKYKTYSLKDFMAYFKNQFVANHTDLNSLITSIVDDYNNTNGKNAFEDLLESTMDDVMQEFSSFSNPIGNVKWFKDGIEQQQLEGNLLTNLVYDSSQNLSMLLQVENKVEYDEIRVDVDSTIYPFFTIGYADDSIVYFNVSPSSPHHLTYNWSFGDLKTSTSKNPIHTYPQFNKSYFVCVTVNNICSSYTYCDTILVDTFLSNNFKLGKGGFQTPKPNLNNKENIDNSNTDFRDGIYLGYNQPNPFDDNTEINYAINVSYNKAFLIVTNTLGQEVINTPLINSSGKQILTSDKLGKGVFYYYLNIDGHRTTGKIMIVR